MLQRLRGELTVLLVAAICVALLGGPLQAQDPQLRFGVEVSRDVEQIYERGLEWLATNQTPQGTWTGGDNGPAITGICLMAFLACGEDPNFGKYRENIRRAARSIIRSQNAQTGYFGSSMYHHGFAMLGLSEVYGALDEDDLWAGDTNRNGQRSVGQSLELAVRCAVTSQKNNPYHAWRYSPEARDADTSVAGAVMMGLLAARNAGVKVPDECIDQALGYFSSMTTDRGEVGYSGIGGGGSANLKAIATLVFSIGKRKDLKQFQPLLDRITANLEHQEYGYIEYFRYYNAQALFQGDFEAWKKWNENLVRQLKEGQNADGSFNASYGQAYGTGMAMLALGLNYRFLPIYER